MRYCAANSLFWELWEYLTNPSKSYYQIVASFHAYLRAKKSTSSLNSFLRYRKEIANFLFSVNWACLATHTYNDDSNLKKPFTFICRQKIKFILHVFLERYCKLIVLGTLDMSDQANPKWYYHLAENFHVYLQVKKTTSPACIPGDLAKICKLLILGTLGVPRCTPPKW